MEAPPKNKKIGSIFYPRHFRGADLINIMGKKIDDQVHHGKLGSRLRWVNDWNDDLPNIWRTKSGLSPAQGYIHRQLMQWNIFLEVKGHLGHLDIFIGSRRPPGYIYKCQVSWSRAQSFLKHFWFGNHLENIWHWIQPLGKYLKFNSFIFCFCKNLAKPSQVW